MSEFLTPAEVAATLRVPLKTVHAWLTSGRLTGAKLGRHWRIRPADLADFIAARTTGKAVAVSAPPTPKTTLLTAPNSVLRRNGKTA